MKKIITVLVTILVALLLSGEKSMAGWKEKITLNQIKVIDYVEKLQKGGNPTTLERPHLRTDEKIKAKLANKELREVMDKAEKLAKQGKNKQIKKPVLQYNLVSEKYYKEIEKRFKAEKKK